jgi:ABC-type glycerol-3-phosphate transport system substrate-binding protein
MRLSRRSTLGGAASIAGGASVLLAACGGGSGQARRFTQEVNPKVTVQYTHEGGNFDEKYQVLAAGGSTPDVGFGTVANYKAHVARGLAGYLDELAKRDKTFKEADYDGYWLEALRYKGKLAGLPWDPGMVSLFYNRGVFAKGGVPLPKATEPMTWEDTVELAKRLTKGPDPSWTTRRRSRRCSGWPTCGRGSRYRARRGIPERRRGSPQGSWR